MTLDVPVDRLTHPLLLARIGHPVTADQHLLVVERQAGDLPAHRQVFEEHLVAASPDVLRRGGVLAVWPVELPDGARAEGLAQREDVALGVGVVDGPDSRALASRYEDRMASHARIAFRRDR